MADSKEFNYKAGAFVTGVVGIFIGVVLEKRYFAPRRIKKQQEKLAAAKKTQIPNKKA